MSSPTRVIGTGYMGKTCTRCDGTGDVERIISHAHQRSGPDGFVDIEDEKTEIDICPRCGGSGEIDEDQDDESSDMFDYENQ